MARRGPGKRFHSAIPLFFADNAAFCRPVGEIHHRPPLKPLISLTSAAEAQLFPQLLAFLPPPSPRKQPSTPPPSARPLTPSPHSSLATVVAETTLPNKASLVRRRHTSTLSAALRRRPPATTQVSASVSAARKAHWILAYASLVICSSRRAARRLHHRNTPFSPSSSSVTTHPLITMACKPQPGAQPSDYLNRKPPTARRKHIKRSKYNFWNTPSRMELVDEDDRQCRLRRSERRLNEMARRVGYLLSVTFPQLTSCRTTPTRHAST